MNEEMGVTTQKVAQKPPMSMDDVRNNPISREEVMALMVGTEKTLELSIGTIADRINNKLSEVITENTVLVDRMITAQAAQIAALQKEVASLKPNPTDIPVISVQARETKGTTTWERSMGERFSFLLQSLNYSKTPEDQEFFVYERDLNLLLYSRVRNACGERVVSRTTTTTLEEPVELIALCGSDPDLRSSYEVAIQSLEQDASEFTGRVMKDYPSVQRRSTPPLMRMFSREMFPNCGDATALRRFNDLIAVDFLKMYKGNPEYCNGDLHQYVKNGLRESAKPCPNATGKPKRHVGIASWYVMRYPATSTIAYYVARRFLGGR